MEQVEGNVESVTRREILNNSVILGIRMATMIVIRLYLRGGRK